MAGCLPLSLLISLIGCSLAHRVKQHDLKLDADSKEDTPLLDAALTWLEKHPGIEDGGAGDYFSSFSLCRSIEFHGSAEALCKGVSADGWQCKPRTLHSSGTHVQASPELNEPVLCDWYINCDCTKEGFTGEYTEAMCSSLPKEAKVDHTEYLKPIKANFCEAFEEACEGLDRHGENATECSEDSCIASFNHYYVKFMRPYEQKKDAGCWGRLAGIGRTGYKVVSTIAQYTSLAKCCEREGTTKWTEGKDLVNSWRPWKFFAGKKVCDGKNGWHGVDATTKEECEKK